MAEEWGYIALEAPKTLAKNTTIESLLDYVNAEVSSVDGETKQIDSSRWSSGFLIVRYDCSEWVDFSEHVLNSSSGFDYFAWHSDEYGTRFFYSIRAGKDSIKVAVEYEEQEDDIETKIQLGKWVESLPVKLLQQQPELNCLDRDDYISSKEAKSINRTKPAPQQNVDCYFRPPVSSEALEAVLDADFHLFDQASNRKGGGLSELFDLMGVKVKEPDVPPDYTVFNWFPISENRSRRVSELLQQIGRIDADACYVNNFSGNSSFPYKLYKVENGVSQTIFDTDDYAEKDLELISDAEDPILNKKVNWFSLDLRQIDLISQKTDLRRHVKDQIALQQQKFAAAEQKDNQEHQEIWEQNKGNLEPVLKDTGFFLYYRKLEARDVQTLGSELQALGMRRLSIEKGLGYSGRNSIVFTEEMRKAAEWLKDNVGDFSEHKLVADDGLDGIVINMQ